MSAPSVSELDFAVSDLFDPKVNGNSSPGSPFRQLDQSNNNNGDGTSDDVGKKARRQKVELEVCCRSSCGVPCRAAAFAG